MKQLLSGNEAVARGAWEAGVRFASAYPGTPSTEILESLTAYAEVDAEWAPNEKVALEAAIGASIAGARSMASMKHVGVNVAADPLLTYAYTGVRGGLVLITADEPGQHSSQNEQDNRHYARMAKIPLLEPSDSQECLDMVRLAFELSEQFDLPVLVRLTTRVCHSKSLVECGARADIPLLDYTKDAKKYVMVPANARVRRVDLERRMKALRILTDETPLNRIELNSTRIGIIASGMCYCYVREVYGDGVSYLKLGLTHPLPTAKIQSFCDQVDRVYVVEENDPYIEETVRALGYEPGGKEMLPAFGELTPEVLRINLSDDARNRRQPDSEKLVPRPPTLCAGCPHRGFFLEAGRRKNVVISGDIGCYALAYAPPYSAMDWCICMGASISAGHGAQKIFDQKGAGTRVISVLGDSTFFHTGIPSLLEVAYNGSRTVNVILDNRTTGMTGHQHNPGTGYNARGKAAVVADIETIVIGCGIRHVRVLNPNHLAEVRAALDWALALDEPSVLITRWPCALKRLTAGERSSYADPFTALYGVDTGLCIGCKTCLRSGCPALFMDAGKAGIDPGQCLGCSVCAQLCPKGAIQPVTEGGD